jgi:hypothetical protein
MAPGGTPGVPPRKTLSVAAVGALIARVYILLLALAFSLSSHVLSHEAGHRTIRDSWNQQIGHER